MIKLLRIDDRLLHGQVAYAWSKHLDINTILIASDVIVNDSMRKMSLNLAKPVGVSLHMKTMKDSIDYLNSEEGKKAKLLILVDNARDARNLAHGCDEVKSINVGGMRMSEGKKLFSKAVALDEQDIQYFKEIEALGVEVEVRQVPTESKKQLKDLL